MTWFVYLIECNDGSIYTGIALDVAARYALHQSGKGARYTRSHPPQRLLAAIACTDRSTASRAEYRIKRLSHREKREFGRQYGPDEGQLSAAAPVVRIASGIAIPAGEIQINAIRAQGAGGQNVNKVSSAIHLRFDIAASSIPDACKERLMKLNDQRISKEGVLVIKAQRYRSQEKNREDGLARLRELIGRVAVAPKKRKPTKPTRSSKEKRLETKSRRSRIKLSRSKVTD